MMKSSLDKHTKADHAKAGFSSASLWKEMHALEGLLFKQQRVIEEQQRCIKAQRLKLKRHEKEITLLKSTRTRVSLVETFRKGVSPFEEVREVKIDVLKRRPKAGALQSSFILASDSPLLVRPNLEVSAEKKAVSQLLHYVAEGEQKAAEHLIQSNPRLLLSKGNIRDLSGRVFKEITAFQYAVWALDWHMWTMLLRYLKQEDAVLQWEALKKHGTAHGVYVSWQGLIDIYAAYSSHGTSDYWIQELGKAQSLLPVHVVNEYCHENRALHPLPNFRSREALTRSRMSGSMDWYAGYRSSQCAYYRNANSSAEITHSWIPVEQDKKAVTSLLATRQTQLAELVGLLTQPFSSQRLEAENPSSPHTLSLLTYPA